MKQRALAVVLVVLAVAGGGLYAQTAPSAQEDDPALYAVGALGASNLYTTYFLLGTLADGYATAAYTASFADELARDVPELDLDRSVPPTGRFHGGTSRARGLLGAFIADKLNRYDAERSDPSLAIESHMSPYLHFGQISPLEIALAVRDVAAPRKDRDAYLEELLVRRELACNYVYYTESYDRWAALPRWARATLRKHQSDDRPYVYKLAELEAARTHDPYWNAAMREMTATGKMHNYMRMYWGKKIIEWTNSPRTAFRWMLALNNKYFLDGRDPASYANVAWCFGLHDRPWAERDVFGTVRYMSAGGLERKFDIDAYVRQCENM